MENNLRKIRKAKNMSQYELADLTNTTPQHIGRLEKGICNLTFQWIERFAKVLNVNPNDIIGTAEPFPNSNYSPTPDNTVIITEDKFMEIISTAFDVFVECIPEDKNKIKDVGVKMAEICLSATKADTTDRKGQLRAMVINLYQKKAI